MPSFDAGSVESRLYLDRSPFTRSLSIARSMAAAFESGEFSAKLDAQLNDLRDSLRNGTQQLGEFAREKAEATLGVNDRPARRTLDGFDEVMRRYGRSWGQQGIRARVTADIRRAQTQLRVLERQLEQTTDEDHRVQIEAEITRARQRLEALDRLATSLGIRRPTMTVGLRGHLATTAQMLGLQRLADRLDGYNIRFRADVDRSLSSALPSILGALEMQVMRYRTVVTAISAVTMPVFYASLGGMPAVFSAAAAGVGSLAIAIAQGLAGGAGIAATALSQGLVGTLGSLGAAAGLGGAALYAFGAATRSATKWTFNLNDVISAQMGDLKSASDAVDVAKAELAKYTKGTKEHAQATIGLRLAKQNLRREEEELNATLQAVTPRTIALGEQAHKLSLRFIALRGAVAHAMAPSLSIWLREVDRRLTQVQPSLIEMVEGMGGVSVALLNIAKRGQQLRSFTTILKGIKEAGPSALWAVGSAAMAAANVLQALVPTGLSVLDTISKLADSAREWTATERGQRRISEVWALLVRQGRRLGSVAWNTGRILFGVFSPATKYAEDFLSYLVKITNQGAKWVESVRGQETISQTWAKLARRGRWLWKVATDLGAALWGVVAALEDSGTVDFMSRSVSRLTGRFRDFMSVTGEGRQNIEDFARSARPVLVAAGSLAKEAADQFFRIADEVISFREEGSKLTVLEEIFKAVEDSLKPLADFFLYEFREVAPLIGPLVEELSLWFSVMARSQPEMKFFIRFLTDMLRRFNSLPDETQRNISRVIAYAAALRSLTGSSGGGLLSSVVVGLAQVAANYWLINKRIPEAISQQKKYNQTLRNQPKVAPPPISPAAPMPAGRRAGPGMPPPVVPAPVPSKNFFGRFFDKIKSFKWLRVGAWIGVAIGVNAAMDKYVSEPLGKRLQKWVEDTFGVKFPKWVDEGYPGLFKALGRKMKEDAEENQKDFEDAGGGIGAAIWRSMKQAIPVVGLGARLAKMLGKGKKDASKKNKDLKWDGLGSFIWSAVKRAIPLIGLGARLARLLGGGKRDANKKNKNLKWGGIGSAIWSAIKTAIPIVGLGARLAKLLGGGKRDANKKNKDLKWGGIGSFIWNAIKRAIPIIGLGARLAQMLGDGKKKAKGKNEGLKWGSIGSFIWGAIKKAVPIVGLGARLVQMLVGGKGRAKEKNDGLKWGTIGSFIWNTVKKAIPLLGLAQHLAQMIGNGKNRAKEKNDQSKWGSIGEFIWNTIKRAIPLAGLAQHLAEMIGDGKQRAKERNDSSNWGSVGEFIWNKIKGGVPLLGLGARLAEMIGGGKEKAQEKTDQLNWAGIGNSMIAGIIEGWSAVNVASILINKISNGYEALRNWLISRSPSRRFAWLGGDMGEGVVVGMASKGARIAASAMRMGQAAADGIRRSAHLPVFAAREMARRVSEAAQANMSAPRMPSPTADGIVRLGEVSNAQWEKLIKRGWKGRAGDRMEALYRPAPRRFRPVRPTAKPTPRPAPQAPSATTNTEDAVAKQLVAAFREEMAMLRRENRQISKEQAEAAVKAAFAAMQSELGRYIQDENLLKNVRATVASMPNVNTGGRR